MEDEETSITNRGVSIVWEMTTNAQAAQSVYYILSFEFHSGGVTLV